MCCEWRWIRFFLRINFDIKFQHCLEIEERQLLLLCFLYRKHKLQAFQIQVHTQHEVQYQNAVDQDTTSNPQGLATDQPSFSLELSSALPIYAEKKEKCFFEEKD